MQPSRISRIRASIAAPTRTAREPLVCRREPSAPAFSPASVYDLAGTIERRRVLRGGRMADLEEHAFKRDKRFVVRLVLTLIVATMGGVFIFGRLTSTDTASCAADTFLGTERK
jgi:hypothetical protein